MRYDLEVYTIEIWVSEVNLLTRVIRVQLALVPRV